MLSEQEIAVLLSAHASLRESGEALIAAANAAGGRDNITVVLLRVAEAGSDGLSHGDEHVTMTGMPAVTTAPEPAAEPAEPLRPRDPAPTQPAGRGKRMRRAGVTAVTLVVIGLVVAGAYVALESVYFIGTNSRGLVTMFRGVPYTLPGNINLYTAEYVSGVSASTLTAERRRTLLDHTLRSEGDAASLVRSLELGQLE
jgi:protein phosphatase